MEGYVDDAADATSKRTKADRTSEYIFRIEIECPYLAFKDALLTATFLSLNPT